MKKLNREELIKKIQEQEAIQKEIDKKDNYNRGFVENIEGAFRGKTASKKDAQKMCKIIRYYMSHVGGIIPMYDDETDEEKIEKLEKILNKLKNVN